MKRAPFLATAVLTLAAAFQPAAAQAQDASAEAANSPSATISGYARIQTNLAGGGLFVEKEKLGLVSTLDTDFRGRYYAETELTHQFHDKFFLAAGAVYEGGPDEEHYRTYLAGAGHNFSLPRYEGFVAAQYISGQERPVLLSAGGTGTISQRLGIEWYANTIKEFRVEAQFRIGKNLSVSAGTDWRYGTGAGLKWEF